jgi:hypothetical protein
LTFWLLAALFNMVLSFCQAFLVKKSFCNFHTAKDKKSILLKKQGEDGNVSILNKPRIAGII